MLEKEDRIGPPDLNGKRPKQSTTPSTGIQMFFALAILEVPGDDNIGCG